MQEAERKTGLVLTRKVTQSATIHTPSGDVIVTLIKVEGKRVRLRFEAPSNIAINRTECLGTDKIKGES